MIFNKFETRRIRINPENNLSWHSISTIALVIKVAGSFLVYRRGSRRHHALFKRTHAERLPRWACGTPGNPRSWNRHLSFAICQLRSSRPGKLQPVLGTDTRYRLAKLTWWQCRRCCNFLWFEDRYFKLNWSLLLEIFLLEIFLLHVKS